MNETIKTVVNETCGEDFDLFEKAFDEKAAHHNFSIRHKRRMNVIFKNCDDPEAARKKLEGKLFCSEFGIKQLAAAAVGFAVIGGLMFGGVKVVDMFTEMSEVNENQNKRYDYLLKDGNYYSEGDSSIYFKVENGSIKLCGDKEKILEHDILLLTNFYPNASEENLKYYYTEVTDVLMSGTRYAVVEMGENYTTDKNGEKVTRDHLKYAFVTGFTAEMEESWNNYNFFFDALAVSFDGEKTLRYLPLGDFVLG